MNPKIRVNAAQAIELACAALVAHGAVRDDAAVQAGHLVEAELRGHPSHGLRRLPMLCARLDAGLIVSGVQADLDWLERPILAVDGRFGFGPCVAYGVIDALIDRAAQTGVAFAAMRRTHHLGMLAPYLETIVGRHAIGLIVTTSEALVHPWGGVGALIGTTPIGIGVPAPGGPVVLDMSTGAVSAGKISEHAEQGRPLLPGWAIDADGLATTDPVAATHGAISPFGGPKGYALGLALGTMVGLLTRTAYGTDVRGTLDATDPTTKGDIMLVLSPAAFGASFSDVELGAYLDLIRSSAAEPSSPVRIPGDRARENRARSLEHGLELDARLWSETNRLAERETTS